MVVRYIPARTIPARTVHDCSACGIELLVYRDATGTTIAHCQGCQAFWRLVGERAYRFDPRERRI